MRLDMGLVKVEVSFPEIRKALNLFRTNRKRALAEMVGEVKQNFSEALNSLLNAELEVFLGQPEQKENKANGSYEREYAIKGIGAVRIKMPRDRNGSFESRIIPRHERMDPRLKEDVAVLHLGGLSTRMMAMMARRLLGMELSHTTVARSLDAVKAEAVKWLTRPLSGRYWALYVDGTNFSIQRRGTTEKEPSLVVLGIDENNHRSVLAIEPGTREDYRAWRAVFRDLKLRGLDPSFVRAGIMDGLPKLEEVFREEFPQAVTLRCWAHAMRNACAKAPKRLHDAFKAMASKVMYAASEGAAREAFDELKLAMEGEAERAIACLDKDLDSLLAHYRFDRRLWRALRTTNAIERVNLEFKRRSRAMGSMGETTLKTMLAFTALKLEMGWRMKAVDAPELLKLGGVRHSLVDEAVTAMVTLN